MYLKPNKLAVCLFSFVSILTAYAQETIPFQLGEDNRIYIDVKINETPAKFVFDTGASGMVANTTQTDHKMNLAYSHVAPNMGANGSSMQRISQGNTIEVGNFKREHQDLIGIAYPEAYYDFDGVIGYPYFDNYYIEIDYQNEELILHKSKNTLPELSNFKKEKIKLLGGVPFIDMSIFSEGKEFEFPVMIDTGYNGELIIYNNIVVKHDLNSKYKSEGQAESEGTDGNVIYSDIVSIPKAKLGDAFITDVPAYLNRSSAPAQFPAILGGEVLKQFHWIIHIRKQLVYLKANDKN